MTSALTVDRRTNRWWLGYDDGMPLVRYVRMTQAMM